MPYQTSSCQKLPASNIFKGRRAGRRRSGPLKLRQFAAPFLAAIAANGGPP